MKIAFVINGTRGDVQPMLALAVGFIKKGHEVGFYAPPENKELVERYNCPFVAFGPNYKELFKEKAHMKGGATASPSPKEMKKQTEDQIDRLPGLIKEADLILGAGFVLGVHTVADKLKAVYRLIIFYPALLGTSKADPLVNRILFGIGRSMTNIVMKRVINGKHKSLGLPLIDDVWGYWMGEQVIVACDKELNAVQETVSFNFTQTAYILLPQLEGLPEHVEEFLNNGKPPVFIGFGSNPISRSTSYGQTFKVVSVSTNQRLIVSKGWGDLPEDNTSDILYVDEMNYEVLFPRLAAIVYHGGTGTMAVAARAGVPQIVFPFMADQFENRKQAVKLGLGPNGCDFNKLSADKLIASINECINNKEFKKNALKISHRLNNLNGLESTVELILTSCIND